MLLISGMFLTCALLQTPPAPRDLPEHLAHPRGYRKQPGARYWDLSVPIPMSFEEWEVYAKLLLLSNEQRRAFEVAYDAYRRSDWAFRVEHVQPVFDRSAEVAAQGVTQLTPDLATQQVALFQARDKVLPGIARIEQTFFAAVAEFLAGPQLESLEKVRLMRERANDMRFGSTFPGFGFDLDIAVVALGEAGIDITPDDPQTFEQLMQAWRVAAASLYARHAEESRRAVEALLLRADMSAAHARGQHELAEEIEVRFTRAREPATNTARRILDLHESSVPSVADHLPPIARQRLVDAFQRAAYRPFTPDSCDLSDFFESLQEQELSLEQRQRIVEIRDAWQITDQAKRDQMLSEYLAWNEKTCTSKSFSSREYLPYAQQMGAIFDSRVAGAELAIATVLEILSKSQRRDATKQADKWRKAVSSSRDAQAQTKAQHGGWPAPYE